MRSNEEVEALRGKVIAHIEAKIRELREARARLSAVLLGEGYIVVSEAGLAINFDIDGKFVVDPRFGETHQVRRFSQDDAITVAASTFDGAGRPARAVHICEALNDDITRDTTLLITLQGQNTVTLGESA